MSANSSSESLKRTCLYEKHKAAGAKFTPFGGWDMPVLYTGVIEEHQTVRTSVGLFDVSHMGELMVKGADAERFLQLVTSNDLRKLKPGGAQYTLLLNEVGGVVDDIIIYQLQAEEYLLCVNAANTDKDFAWLTGLRTSVEGGRLDFELTNESARFAQIAVQGPKARTVVGELIAGSTGADRFLPAAFPAFTFRPETLSLGGREVELLVAATGYTGEDGFEIFCPAEAGPLLWDRLLEVGAPYGIKPAGLGARDTLRLEVCYPLHGHELRDDLPALACGVGWVIKLAKQEFVGKEALVAVKQQGLTHTLIGFEVRDRGIVRADAPLFSDGRQVGWVSSGTHSPTLGKAVGLGFVPPALATPGTVLQAEVRGKFLEVAIAERPLYRRPQ